MADLCAVGKPLRRSRAATLVALKRDLGRCKLGHLDRQRLVSYALELLPELDL